MIASVRNWKCGGKLGDCRDGRFTPVGVILSYAKDLSITSVAMGRGRNYVKKLTRFARDAEILHYVQNENLTIVNM